MTSSEIVKFLIIRNIGNFLVLFAIFGVFAAFGPAIYYEINFKLNQLRGVHFSITNETSGIVKSSVKSPNVGFADILAGPKEQILIPIDTNFDILIPKIGANAKVFPNIDASSPNEFLPILQKGVAHAQGSVFPGMKGNIYLFAHSADNFWDVGRYNAVFYLLKDLTAGDDIVVFFDNKRHNYVVSETKIVDPQETSYIVNAQTGNEKLILQTCWPPGTTWKRLMVFAEPK